VRKFAVNTNLRFRDRFIFRLPLVNCKCTNATFFGSEEVLFLAFSHLPLAKVCEVKLCCDDRFTHAFTACSCVFKVITLVGSNRGNYFENATACSKRTLKTTVIIQLKGSTRAIENYFL